MRWPKSVWSRRIRLSPSGSPVSATGTHRPPSETASKAPPSPTMDCAKSVMHSRSAPCPEATSSSTVNVMSPRKHASTCLSGWVWNVSANERHASSRDTATRAFIRTAWPRRDAVTAAVRAAAARCRPTSCLRTIESRKPGMARRNESEPSSKSTFAATALLRMCPARGMLARFLSSLTPGAVYLAVRGVSQRSWSGAAAEARSRTTSGSGSRAASRGPFREGPQWPGRPCPGRPSRGGT